MNRKRTFKKFTFNTVLRISNKRTAFFLLDQFSITLICVPSYDRSYNVYLFPIGL